jgi:hypothetical protein
MVINYNPYLIGSLPRSYFEDTYSQYLSSNYSREKLDKEISILKSLDAYKQYQTFIDRTKTRDHFLDIKILYPMPSAGSSDSFDLICSDTVLSILNENKKINIYWSGGLDSTNMLMCFLYHQPEKHQVKVLMNYNSIIESGYVFDTFIKNNFDYEIVLPKIHENEDIFFNQDEIYLTGQPADLMGKSYLSKNVTDEMMDSFSDVILNSPKPIKNKDDFGWFIGFNYRWQTCCLASFHVVRNSNLKENYPEVVRAFYNSISFQRWSINNNRADYNKQFMKENILLFGGKQIKEYTVNKKRTPSMYGGYKRNYLLTTDKFENIYVDKQIIDKIYKK